MALELALSSTHKLLSVANQICKQPPPVIWKSLVTARHRPQSHQNRAHVFGGRQRGQFRLCHVPSGRGQWLFLRSNCYVVAELWNFFSFLSFEGKEMLHAKGQLGGGYIFFSDKMNHSSNSSG